MSMKPLPDSCYFMSDAVVLTNICSDGWRRYIFLGESEFCFDHLMMSLTLPVIHIMIQIL